MLIMETREKTQITDLRNERVKDSIYIIRPLKG